jgi:hypothetical protein
VPPPLGLAVVVSDCWIRWASDYGISKGHGCGHILIDWQARLIFSNRNGVTIVVKGDSW